MDSKRKGQVHLFHQRFGKSGVSPEGNSIVTHTFGSDNSDATAPLLVASCRSLLATAARLHSLAAARSAPASCMYPACASAAAVWRVVRFCMA